MEVLHAKASAPGLSETEAAEARRRADEAQAQWDEDARALEERADALDEQYSAEEAEANEALEQWRRDRDAHLGEYR